MQATRLGDTDTGHDACPGTVLVSSSTNVIINLGASAIVMLRMDVLCIHRIQRISPAAAVQFLLMDCRQQG